MSSYNSLSIPGSVKEQYGTAANLTARIALHRIYSTNKQGWANWVFENYIIKPGMAVLELGCGNGVIWKEHAAEIPGDVRLVLSDFSSGMLEEARKNTADMGFVEYREIDAQSIPCGGDTFDIVIANHMLYHVPDIHKALGEIARVMKPLGTLYATTSGFGNMRELGEILEDFDSAIDFDIYSGAAAFGLENGGKILEKFFAAVETRRYEDSLRITESTPLVDYILSFQGIGSMNRAITGDKVQAFERYIAGLIAQKGYIDISKEAGMFVSAKPL